MKHHQILSRKTKEVMFEGFFENFSACLEEAVSKKIAMPYADLSHCELANANLDDAILPYARFYSANLTGANLSEAQIAGASFEHTELYNTCFSFSDLRGCDFSGAHFGGTDIAGADLSGCKFSTLSCFTLNFILAEKLELCLFQTHQGDCIQFSSPPTVTLGLAPDPVIVCGERTLFGHAVIDGSTKIAGSKR